MGLLRESGCNLSKVWLGGNGLAEADQWVWPDGKQVSDDSAIGAEVSLLQGEGSAWCWQIASGKQLTVWMTQVSRLSLRTTGLLLILLLLHQLQKRPNHPRQKKPRILAGPKHLHNGN